jgi:hypothetical protein
MSKSFSHGYTRILTDKVNIARDGLKTTTKAESKSLNHEDHEGHEGEPKARENHKGEFCKYFFVLFVSFSESSERVVKTD